MSLKKLHRIYFGFDGKPDMFGAYLDTWTSELPDFEICHWNASNLPMNDNEYTRALFEERDHAFLTDYFRWWVLREYGGVYLDADIEVVNGNLFRQLVEELDAAAGFDAFIGIDERGGGWYTAHSMASKPQSEISKFMCETYAGLGNLKAWRKKALYLWAPQLAALYFAHNGHNVAGMGTTPNLDHPTVESRVKIYPQDYFSPLVPTGNKSNPFKLTSYTENTSICHHFACTWHDADSIYASYAKEKGGSANTMLRDISANNQVQIEDAVRKLIPASVKSLVRRLVS
jgi:hypothetical protein